MLGRTISLSDIMSSWRGQEVILLVQGSRMKPFLQELCANKTNSFDLPNEKLKNENDHLGTLPYSKNETELIFEGLKKNNKDRVSLADVGQFYSNKKGNEEIIGNKDKKFGERDDLSENKAVLSSLKGIPLKDEKPKQQPKKTSNTIRNKIMQQKANNEEEKQRLEIMSYIEKMVFTLKSNLPEFYEINEKFLKEKQITLENLSKAKSLSEMEEIIIHFKNFAEEITMEIRPEETLTQHKNLGAFSFNEDFKLEAESIFEEPLKLVEKKTDHKVEIVNFSQFKDDNGSFCSIKSENENITHVDFLPKEQNKTKVINESKVKEEDFEIKTHEDENCLSGEMKVEEIKNTNEQPETKAIDQTEKNDFRKEVSNNSQVLIQNSNSRLALEFEQLTKTPVKIIRNLEEAQQFDPSVVKFTEYKVKFIETRRITPEIIRIHSPYKTRPREEMNMNPSIQSNFPIRQNISS